MATVGVFAAIFDERGRILCVHQRYAGEMWSSAGGGLLVGEAPDVGLVREVREETGLLVTVEYLIGVYAKPYADDLLLFYRAREIGRSAWTPDAEIAEWGYFARDSLPRPMRPTASRRIEDAFAGRRGVSYVFTSPDASGYDVGSVG